MTGAGTGLTVSRTATGLASGAAMIARAPRLFNTTRAARSGRIDRDRSMLLLIGL